MPNSHMTMTDTTNSQAGLDGQASRTYNMGSIGRAGHEAAAARGRTALRRLATALLCIALWAAFLGVLPLPAQAEGPQLPGGDYPDAQCTSPLRPFAGDKAWEWDLYRQKMGAYRACVDAYVRRARADIGIIQGKIDKAVREYNREVTMP